MSKSRTVKKVVKSGNKTVTTTKRGGRTTTTTRTTSGGGMGGKSKAPAKTPPAKATATKATRTPSASRAGKLAPPAPKPKPSPAPKPAETEQEPAETVTETVTDGGGMSSGENFLTLLLLLACIGVYLNYRPALTQWWQKYVLTKPAPRPATATTAATAPQKATASSGKPNPTNIPGMTGTLTTGAGPVALTGGPSPLIPTRTLKIP